MSRFRRCVCLISILATAIQLNAAERRIGKIAFFGQEGFDTAVILNGLPFRVGTVVTPADNEQQIAEQADRWKKTAKDAIKRIIGQNPTDVERVCCDPSGDLLVYIGLPGKSFRAIRYNRTPTGSLRLPQSLLYLEMEIDDMKFKAVLAGKASEDVAEGYALSKDDPVLRSKQLEFRDQARKIEADVFQVAESSKDAEQRAVAVQALGYARQTRQQIAALVKASLDPDGEVRNNAARALGVLLLAKPELDREIPSKPFIDLLSSGTWTDRNKGLMVVLGLAQRRNAGRLREIRSRALKPLLEMARWDTGHAITARLILGYIAGIDDERLTTLVNEEPPATLLSAFRSHERQ
jgi:HEAT repeat protein